MALRSPQLSFSGVEQRPDSVLFESSEPEGPTGGFRLSDRFA